MKINCRREKSSFLIFPLTLLPLSLDIAAHTGNYINPGYGTMTVELKDRNL
jgi:hypothetical protein